MQRLCTPVAKVAAPLGVLLLLLPACLKVDDFPPEPSISFKEFAQFGDSASLVMHFTDGDGDIGLNASDTFPPYDGSSVYYHNLFLEYYELENGVWPAEPVAFVSPLYYRVPVVTPTGQNKTLEGEIAVAIATIDGHWYAQVGSAAGDTVRFSMKLVDRALHESNTVFSDPIIVQ